jgi:hypothetical protein
MQSSDLEVANTQLSLAYICRIRDQHCGRKQSIALKRFSRLNNWKPRHNLEGKHKICVFFPNGVTGSKQKQETGSAACSPQANYTDRAAGTCRRTFARRGVGWSAQRVPKAVGVPLHCPRDTPLSTEVGNKIRGPVAVVQSIEFASGLRAKEFVVCFNIADAQSYFPSLLIIRAVYLRLRNKATRRMAVVTNLKPLNGCEC